MNRSISLVGLILMFTQGTAFGQNPREIISEIFNAQSALKNVSYTLDRRDTLLTDHVRTMSGRVKIEVDKKDSILGFKYWGKKDGETGERIYDGRAAYEIDPVSKKYTLTTSKSGIISNSYSGGGGHLVFPDLVRLDTTGAERFLLSTDSGHYYLTLTYPDYAPENVVKRFKIFTIDKKTMLPVAMRNHQEAYGKVQDLFFKVRTININDANLAYDFLNLAFLNNYKHEVHPESSGKMPIMNLLNKKAPDFTLTSFSGGEVSSGNFNGKAVLIDLWEVWCAPCIASMPGIETFYEKYKDRGLLVYGITNDPRALSAAKAMVQKKGVKIPMLIGNDQFKKDYLTSNTSLPLYILIDKKGIIKMLFPGFTNEIEVQIIKALME